MLKPGGHVLAVDFGATSQDSKSFLDRFHRHGRVAVQDIVRLLGVSGLEVIESGPVGLRAELRLREGRMRGRHWMLPALVAVLAAGHGVILYYLSARVVLSVGVVVGVLLLLGLRHRGLLRRLPARSDLR